MQEIKREKTNHALVMKSVARGRDIEVGN